MLSEIVIKILDLLTKAGNSTLKIVSIVRVHVIKSLEWLYKKVNLLSESLSILFMNITNPKNKGVINLITNIERVAREEQNSNYTIYSNFMVSKTVQEELRKNHSKEMLIFYNDKIEELIALRNGYANFFPALMLGLFAYMMTWEIDYELKSIHILLMIYFWLFIFMFSALVHQRAVICKRYLNYVKRTIEKIEQEGEEPQ
ncbi:hypothetical protein CHH78_02485 [Shouchella clausii]|uniref:hypothetical protein n=1 Tax=Shouchella clausii TaxID=79880 RepID=UPI000BA56553|nr:hypothetical protein [Shouchella clausii]PAD10202.1 hypothetical protein CHH76_05675 [Shouchella clausii]PAD90591.1 hypothetical protein CHH52_19195 [Shouchella clausii]PAE86184.1 hypothetical protein CHH78_02485 [Shouchella clausii]PAF06866.1 hypothetical protein CHH66_02480 [Shouchella clausii]